MNEPKKNEWLSPPAILGVVGLVSAFGMAYSRFDGRVSVAEAASAQLEKRIDNMERKIDFMVQRMIEKDARQQ